MDCLFQQKTTVTGMIKFVAKDLENKIKMSDMDNPKLKKLVINNTIFIYESKKSVDYAKNEFMTVHIIPEITNKVRRFKDDNSFVIGNWNISRLDDYNREYTESELNEIKKYGYSIHDNITKTIIFRNNDTNKEYFVETKLRK
tara:strand:- start:58 stop:486 length:429 start_codon:yes stop_codon:yes gene_type:complete